MGDDKKNEDLEDVSGGPNGGPANHLEEVDGGVGSVTGSEGAYDSNNPFNSPLDGVDGGESIPQPPAPLDDVEGGYNGTAPKQFPD